MKVMDVVNEALRIAKGNPEFQYESHNSIGCTYVKEEGDSLVGDCLFGRALINLGFDADTLKEADANLYQGSGSSISTILVENGIAKGEEDDELLLACDHVQIDQDSGRNWGEAIVYLENYLEHPQ